MNSFRIFRQVATLRPHESRRAAPALGVAHLYKAQTWFFSAAKRLCQFFHIVRHIGFEFHDLAGPWMLKSEKIGMQSLP